MYIHMYIWGLYRYYYNVGAVSRIQRFAGLKRLVFGALGFGIMVTERTLYLPVLHPPSSTSKYRVLSVTVILKP